MRDTLMQKHFGVLIHRVCASLATLFLLWGGTKVDAASTRGAAQLKLSCKVAWTSVTGWSKDFRDSEDKPYNMSIAADEQVNLSGDLTFEQVDGSWEIVDEKSQTSASGAGKYSITGKNAISKSVTSVLSDPGSTNGHVSIRALDFEGGFAVIRFGKPSTTTEPECFECGFIAFAAFGDCMASISTNQNTFAPEEVRVEFTPGNKAFSATGSTNWSQSGTCGSDSIQAMCTLGYTPGEWEAVIIPPSELDTWLPAGSKDRYKPGNSMSVNVQLRHKGEKEPAADMTGTFYVTLEDVSQQPGYCVNAPARDEASDDPDLKLKEGDNLWLDDDATGQTEEDTNEQSVTIESYDFGAYGRLRVEVVVNDGTTVKAHLEDDPGKDYLDLPKDDNNNHIADAWEKDKGVEELPAKWDEADQPAGQHTLGDGISLYEKYRGFVVKGYHQRLEPYKKHVFVYDPTGWALKTTTEPGGVSFIDALDCEVIFVDEKNWTGPGGSGAKKRLVNFNSTDEVHATDQHALHLRFPFTDSPLYPADYNDMLKAKFGTNNTEAVTALGLTFPDQTAAAWGSPAGWMAVEVYANNIDKWSRATALYHTFGLPEFAHYSDPATSAAERTRLDERARTLRDEYITANSDSYEKRNWSIFSATPTHEVGHGLGIKDLTSPGFFGPSNCVMRYFQWDGSRTPNDRFELAARSPWPDIYCRSAVGTVDGISCWNQIQVTDRSDAPRSPAAAGLRSRERIHLLTDPISSHTAGTLVDEAPALTLTSELLWDEPLAGDPLRIEVSLSCRAYQQALLHATQTGTNVPATLLYPTIATNWHENLDFVLYRYGDDSRWVEVLSSIGSPNNYLRPLAVSPDAFGQKPLARSREWLLPPEAIQLTPGKYFLTVLWDGDGMVEEEALPDFGYMSAQDIRFTVNAVTNDVQRAIHEHRLAFRAYAAGDYLSAWQHSQAALEVADARSLLLAEGAQMMSANAALKLGNYRGALATLQDTDQGDRNELGRFASGLREVLAPEISLNPASARTSAPRVMVVAFPRQKYEVQYSENLITWTTLDQRLTETNQYEVTDSGNTARLPRFYRAVWLP